MSLNTTKMPPRASSTPLPKATSLPQNPPNPMPPPSSNPSNKIPSYSEKAAFKPHDRVENILHVYASHDSKVPITNADWHVIEQNILRTLLTHDSGSIDDLLVARSGYDAAHSCGFIAAESAASAEWHKRVVSEFGEGGKKFRAWARGEHPTLFQLRVFLPSKYNIIPSIDSTKLLKTYNPFLNEGTFELQREERVGEGRALFFSISRNAFLKVRETYKLNFPLGKVDCNNATLKALTTTRAAIPKPTPTQIPPPPISNQTQIDHAIQALATEPPPPSPQPPSEQAFRQFSHPQQHPPPPHHQGPPTAQLAAGALQTAHHLIATLPKA